MDVSSEEDDLAEKLRESIIKQSDPAELRILACFADFDEAVGVLADDSDEALQEK